MTLFNFFVLLLATCRITNIFIKEDGPWDFAHNLRRSVFAGEFTPTDPDFEVFTDAEKAWWLTLPAIPAQGFFGKLLSCPLCASVWVGAALGWLGLLSPRLALFVAIPFALSAIYLLPGDDDG